MDAKDAIALGGILVTLAVSTATLLYSIWSNKRTFFVNTVTASRLKWIDSLRDKVAEFIAVTIRLLDLRGGETGQEHLQRDMLLHQNVLHLNPYDPEDQSIRALVDSAKELTDRGAPPSEVSGVLVKLRDATGDYLKKEWNRVKRESTNSRR